MNILNEQELKALNMLLLWLEDNINMGPPILFDEESNISSEECEPALRKVLNSLSTSVEQPSGQAESPSTISATPLLLSQILENGSFTEEQANVLKDKGWPLRQDNDDYTDFEFEATYQTEEENNDDRYSFNIHLTFDWQGKIFYLTLGTNLGDGFNDYHNVPFDDKRLEVSLENYVETLSNQAEMGADEDEFLALTTKYPEAWKDVVAATAKLSDVLGIQ